jgi:hypothetical protein
MIVQDLPHPGDARGGHDQTLMCLEIYLGGLRCDQALPGAIVKRGGGRRFQLSPHKRHAPSLGAWLMHVMTLSRLQ